MTCSDLARSIQNTFYTTQDDLLADPQYMTDITAMFDAQGITLPGDITTAADVLAHCGFDFIVIDGGYDPDQLELIWDQDADRKRTICPDGSLSFTNENSNGYRFGFNGQERDDDVSGVGNTNTATFWEYDARIGRRWNLDPKPQISISDYAVMGNNPIANVDILGDKFKAGDEAAQQDIKSMVSSKYRDAIKFDKDGYADIDFSVYKQKFTNKKGVLNQKAYDNFVNEGKADAGVELIQLLKDDNLNYLYTSSYIYEANYVKSGEVNDIQGSQTIDWSSKKGTTSGEKGWFYNVSATSRNGENTNTPDGMSQDGFQIWFFPPAGFDGYVNIMPGAVYNQADKYSPLVKVDRASYVYHELMENYCRTNLKMPYDPAHLESIKREGRNSRNPYGNPKMGHFSEFEYK